MPFLQSTIFNTSKFLSNKLKSLNLALKTNFGTLLFWFSLHIFFSLHVSPKYLNPSVKLILFLQQLTKGLQLKLFL